MKMVVDRLSLQIPGLDAASAARLGRLIGERLADMDWAGHEPPHRIKPIVLDHAERDLGRLATRIAAAIQRQIGEGAP